MSQKIYNYPHEEISINDINDLDEEIDYQDLYLQFIPVNAMEEENREKSRLKQLEDVLIYLQNVKAESILDHTTRCIIYM